MKKRVRAIVRGRVQGVGFRPTVYRHAVGSGVAGFVLNAPEGVVIEVEGEAEQIADFFERLRTAPPPQARIEHIGTTDVACRGEKGFEIVASERSGDPLVGMPPDLATCPDCARELLEPADRRFRYPFTNCTNCGPRFTIITELPYDRPYTSMAGFEMCEACRREYEDPLDRRFDAQPNACPVCGPRVSLIDAERTLIQGDAIEETIRRVRAGQVVAVKGLGGYHLCCDAGSDDAVGLLRKRKRRPAKALAVMFPSLEEVGRHCVFDDREREELVACSRPIVILRQRPESGLSVLVAPDTNDIGCFLPYTPVHILLLRELGPVVMTSGNLSEEPIVSEESELDRLLGPIADCALVHDRPIVRRCDDSVVRIVDGRRQFLRRSRGFVPEEFTLPFGGPSALACGGELKNTFCVTRRDQALASQHIGDLSELSAFEFYRQAIGDMVKLLEVEPAVVAHDLHPDYRSTRFALASQIPLKVGVQHHHAHVAGCMVEHDLTLEEPDRRVIGVALDGSGYGTDGTVWGGEFLVAGLADFQRTGHIEHQRLPGGEEGIRHPARMAFSHLIATFGNEAESVAARLLPELEEGQLRLLGQMVRRGIRSPVTSSAGRLFDAVSALLGICGTISYEGQAAIRLETAAEGAMGEAYPFELIPTDGPFVLSFKPMIREIVREIDEGVMRKLIAARFHETVARAVVAGCSRLREQTGLAAVILTGGVYQNALLLSRSRALLREAGFEVYANELVAPNDAGVSFGQAVVALARQRGATRR